MLYVALALVAAVVVETLAFAALIRAQIRQAARERDLLVNQVCSLAGKPWQPPPSQEWTAPVDEDAGRYFAIPDHLPE